MELLCPAKVNLALSVGSARDDGYHPIASWMVAVDFADRVVLSPDSCARFDITFAEDAPIRQAVDWPIEKDLGWRAYRLLEKWADRPLPTRVEVNKRIPAGGGLGGGSADAAGVLVGINRLHGLGLDTATLIQLGATLGCDVAFAVAALSGTPSVLATGLGETLESAPLSQPIDLVLVLPPFGCPTGPVYQAFDESTKGTIQEDVTRVRRTIETTSGLNRALFNDLALPATVAQPRLAAAIETLEDSLERIIHVTGSGSTMFALAEDPGDAESMVRHIRDRTEMAAIATRTLAAPY